MPIYEYRCESCGTKFSVVFWPPDQPQPRCRRCGSTQARRLISRVALLHGEEDRLERLADDLTGVDEDDPRSVERWARRLGKEMGEELGEDFEQAVEEAASSAGSGDDSEGDNP